MPGRAFLTRGFPAPPTRSGLTPSRPRRSPYPAGEVFVKQLLPAASSPTGWRAGLFRPERPGLARMHLQTDPLPVNPREVGAHAEEPGVGEFPPAADREARGRPLPGQVRLTVYRHVDPHPAADRPNGRVHQAIAPVAKTVYARPQGGYTRPSC